MDEKQFDSVELNSISLFDVIKHYYSKIPDIRWMGITTLITVICTMSFTRWLLPLFIQQSIDTVVNQHQFPAKVFVLFSLAILCNIIAWRIIEPLWSKFQARGIQTLREYIYEQLLSRNIHFYHNESHGNLISKSGRYIRAFEALFDTLVFDGFFTLIPVAVAVIVSFNVYPLLGTFLLLWSIGFTFVAITLRKKRDPLEQSENELDSKLTAKFADVLSNISSVLSFGKQNREIKEVSDVSHKHTTALDALWDYSNNENRIRSTLTYLLQTVGIFVSLLALSKGEITVGEFALLQGYVFMVDQTLWNVGRLIQRMSTLLNDSRSFMLILNKTAEHYNPVTDESDDVQLLTGEIAIKGVTYTYPKTIKPALKTFNLSIPYGQKIGIVGETGAGKSTLTQLLLGLIRPNIGTYTIGNCDTDSVTNTLVRSSFAYVPQETALFHRTIKENISYLRPNATDEEIYAAAKKAHAHDFILDLKEGYESKVGERGVKLSGGQRQRIALARAILADRPFVILDEATSALDVKTERLIQQVLDEAFKEKTLIVIAHRLSTIQHLDRIIVLSNGTIAEDGTHNELLNKEGIYHELVQHQIASNTMTN